MNQELKKNSHCSYCGTLFTEQVLWPRKCVNCSSESFSNPTPVAVVLISIWDGDRLGCLIQQRNIDPKKGEWALTGGYMDLGETWEQTAARELREEVGLITQPTDYQLMGVTGSANNLNILVFGLCTRVFDLKEIPFVPNHEVSAIAVANKPMELAFPSHTEMLAKFLGRSNRLCDALDPTLKGI